MTDSAELEKDIHDLELGTGYSIICKNRPPNNRGYSAGGVALAFRKSHIEFKEIVMQGNEYEMIFAVGTMPNFTKKFIAICVYLPPACLRQRWIFPSISWSTVFLNLSAVTRIPLLPSLGTSMTLTLRDIFQTIRTFHFL